MKLEAPFAYGDRIIIDGGKDLVAVVTGFTFRTTVCTCEVSWMHNGALQTQWVENWRLAPAIDEERR